MPRIQAGLKPKTASGRPLTNLEQVSAGANPLSRLIITLTADVSLERLGVAYTQFNLANGSNVLVHDDHTVQFYCVDVSGVPWDRRARSVVTRRSSEIRAHGDGSTIELDRPDAPGDRAAHCEPYRHGQDALTPGTDETPRAHSTVSRE